MVAYSFQRRFIGPIEDGSKRQTLRAHGFRRHARQGDELQLYFGMRTKSCRLILRTQCAQVGTVWVNFDEPAVMVTLGADDPTIFKNHDDREAFARADGFESWADLVGFWSEEHFDGKPPEGVWSGVIVKW